MARPQARGTKAWPRSSAVRAKPSSALPPGGLKEPMILKTVRSAPTWGATVAVAARACFSTNWIRLTPHGELFLLR